MNERVMSPSAQDGHGGPPTAAGGEQAEGEVDVAALCEQTAAFSRSLAGPLKRVAVRRGSTSVEVDWHEPAPVAAATAAPAPAAPAPQAAAVLASDGTAAASPPDEVVDEGSTHLVLSPLVGTFYRSPAPGEDPFVAVGTPVVAGQTLAIVEAMKLMNPIVADVDGQVLEVLVSDGDAVEYDQPLVRIAVATGAPVDTTRAG